MKQKNNESNGKKQDEDRTGCKEEEIKEEQKRKERKTQRRRGKELQRRAGWLAGYEGLPQMSGRHRGVEVGRGTEWEERGRGHNRKFFIPGELSGEEGMCPKPPSLPE